MEITVKVKRLDKGMPMPVYAYPGDAAFDLCTKENFSIQSGEKKEIPTGIAFEIPEGCVGFVWDKSSVGIKKGIKTLGGVVDSGYRGEIIVGLVNLSGQEHSFSRGDKIAQMVIQKKETVSFSEENLGESVRGDKGFGSSGA